MAINTLDDLKAALSGVSLVAKVPSTLDDLKAALQNSKSSQTSDEIYSSDDYDDYDDYDYYDDSDEADDDYYKGEHVIADENEEDVYCYKNKRIVAKNTTVQNTTAQNNTISAAVSPTSNQILTKESLINLLETALAYLKNPNVKI